MNLDKFTFGSRPGMVNLTDILNKLNDKKITRKCGYLISSFCFKMCYCKTHSRAVTLEVLQFYKKKYLSLINNLDFPENVKGHLRGVIVSYYKTWFKVYNSKDIKFYYD